MPRPANAVGLKWYTAATKDWTYSEIPTPAAHGAGLPACRDRWPTSSTGRPAIATAEEGRTALRMTLACYVSNQAGERVRLDDPRIDQV